jgi:hypothetical protein
MKQKPKLTPCYNFCHHINLCLPHPHTFITTYIITFYAAVCCKYLFSLCATHSSNGSLKKIIISARRTVTFAGAHSEEKTPISLTL